MNWEDKKGFMRLFAVDGVSVIFEQGILLVTVGETKNIIKAEEQDDGTWVLWDTAEWGWEWVGNYACFPAVWGQVDDLISTIITEWYSKHSNNLSALFVGLR